MLEIRNLTVEYFSDNKAVTILDKINFSLSKGKSCAIIGSSGCGKSTFLRSVAGLERLKTGEVLFEGRRLSNKESCISFMPQNYGLLPWKKVRDNILLPQKIKRKYNEARFNYLINKLGIADLLERYPRELSGGQQQRVSLARTFLLAPDLLLMDEPFSALDAITRENMQDIFLNLWQENNMTTLLVTHYVEEAVYLGQLIVIMAPYPRGIAEVIENPLFGSSDLRNKAEFFSMGREIRKKIREVSEINE